MEQPKEYLGDGVYAIFDGYGIWLHANDHKNPTDKVYLDPYVLETLNRFYKRCIDMPKKEKIDLFCGDVIDQKD